MSGSFGAASAGGSSITPLNVLATRATTTQASIAHATFTTIIYNNEITDNQNAYNAATGVLTIPSGFGGKYLVNAGIQTDANNTRFVIGLFINGSEIKRLFDISSATDTLGQGTATAIATLNAGDQITVRLLFTNSGSAIRAVTTNGLVNFLDVTRIA